MRGELPIIEDDEAGEQDPTAGIALRLSCAVGCAGFASLSPARCSASGRCACIGSLGAAVGAAIRADARVLFGGDVSARLVHREASAAERRFLDQSGEVSEVALLQSMAVSLDGARHTLIELQAVDAGYPLYGAVSLMPAQDLAGALAARGGVYGAVAAPAVAERLGLEIGDRFKIGAGQFELRATAERLPDAALSGLAFGPTIVVAAASLGQTALLQPGALVSYDYRLKLPPGSDPAVVVRGARGEFPDAGWQVRTANEASPALQRFIDRIELFLGLVAITTLLVGGIGIGSAVGNFVAGKTATIATLKSLGASTRLVFAVYAVQIGLLALAGILIGLVVGALLPLAVAPFVARLLPHAAALWPPPTAAGGRGGGRGARGGALRAAAARRDRPGDRRGRAAPRHRRAQPRRAVPRAALAGTAAAGLVLAALVALTAPDRKIALWYVAGALVAFAVFRLAGAAVEYYAVAKGGRPAARGMPCRASRSTPDLHRPGAPTERVVLSLGIGLTVLAAVALVQASLSAEIEGSIAEGAPAYFFLDIQPDQLDGFTELVRAIPGLAPVRGADAARPDHSPQRHRGGGCAGHAPEARARWALLLATAA